MSRRSRVGPAADNRITVMFVQTQSYFGADSQIHASIAEHLDPDRFRVIVACNDGRGDGVSAALEAFSRIPHVEVLPTDFGPTRDGTTPGRLILEAARRSPFVWDLFQLARFTRRQRVDVVHGTEKPRDVLYGFFLARLSGAKAVTHLHVKVEDWIRPLTRRIMRHDDGLIGVSEFVALSAADIGYRPEQIHHVLNGLETKKWNPDHVEASTIRRDLEIDDGVPLVGIVARVFPWKGHESLIRALAVLRNRGLSFHLLIVGEDDPRATPDGSSHSGDLGRLVDELEFGGHVSFTGFRSDVPNIMAALDVFAMPSFEEPFGMVYLEAMAMRTPVVACRSGGVVEFIEEGVTGLLSDPGDITGLADNIAALITDPALRERMGAAGRQSVLAGLSARHMADDMAAVYERLLDRVPAN